MHDSDSHDRLQQLEQRHTRLIEELDTLNHRLEQALNSFSKPTDSPAEKVSRAEDVEQEPETV